MPQTDQPSRVVVVEDDDMVRVLLEIRIRLDHRLELAGAFPDASTGLAAVQQRCPDMIVCDVSMTPVSGLEILPELRRSCPHAAIVMYTGYPEGAETSIQLGADAVYAKGDASPALLDLLVELAGQKRRLRG